MTALDGVDIKMARSREHIECLRDETSAFIKDNPVRYRREADDDPVKGWAFYVSWDRQVPGRFGAIIGDALTNMRAALDHLAWNLVLASANSPNRYTNFPIASKPPERGKNLPLLNVIPTAARPIVEGVQPYQNSRKGRPPEVHPLHVLKLLVNADKHQALTVTEMFGAASDIRVTARGGQPVYGRAQTPGGLAGDKIAWLPDAVFDTESEWEVFATIEPILALDVGHRRMEPIVDLLVSMANYVEYQTIDLIAAACV